MSFGGSQRLIVLCDICEYVHVLTGLFRQFKVKDKELNIFFHPS